MTRKRFLVILIACIFCLGMLYAWGTQSDSTAQEDNGPITLFLSEQDDYLTLLQKECKTAAEENGYQFKLVNAKGDQDKQISQIKKAAKKGEGAFLVNLVDPSRASEVIEAAGNRDIVFLNKEPVDHSVLDDTHIYVGSEEKMAGELQGQVLAEYCQSEGITELHYLLLLGPESLPSSQQRADAMLEVMEQTGFTMEPLCEPLMCEYKRDQAKKAVAEQLANGLKASEIDCILSTNDAMALGALDALAGEADANPIVVGVDGIPDALEAIQDGSIMMTAYQDAARQAETAIKVANNLNHGYAYNQGIRAVDRVDDNIFWISFQSVTQDNVSEFLGEEE
jgi:ABC-type sugar transport system substrate-binding protein